MRTKAIRRTAAVIAAAALWMGATLPQGSACEVAGGSTLTQGSTPEVTDVLVSTASASAITSNPAAPHHPLMDSPWGTRATEYIPIEFVDKRIIFPAPAVMISGTTMVPGGSLLEGMGYRVAWDPDTKQLTAARPTGPALTFWIGRSTAEADGRPLLLRVPPYMDSDGLVWIPLRAAAEAIGLEVRWNPQDRSVTVRDPFALPMFRMSTRADLETAGPADQILLYMTQEMGVNVELELIPSRYYNEKINILIAAGEPSDLMLIGRPYQYNGELFQAIASDLTDVLKQFPRLTALAESADRSNRSIDGRIYGIPRPGHLNDAVFPFVQQEWLDRLGLAYPRTMDEVYRVLEMFVKHDPDGHGEVNSIGLTGRLLGDALGGIGWVEQVFTGTPTRFVYDDGELRDTAVSAEERDALQWLAKSHAAGLIDDSFAVTDDESVRFQLEQGRVGMVGMTMTQAAALSKSTSASDHGNWVPLTELRTASGEKFIPLNTMGNGLYIIPRTVPHDRMMYILTWLDHGLAMMESNGWQELSDLTDSSYTSISNVFGNRELLPEISTRFELPEPIRDRYEEAVSSWQDHVVEHRLLPPSFELVLRQEEYIMMNEQLDRWKNQVVLGEMTLNDWDRHIESMTQSDTYRTMMQELEREFSSVQPVQP